MAARVERRQAASAPSRSPTSYRSTPRLKAASGTPVRCPQVGAGGALEVAALLQQQAEVGRRAAVSALGVSRHEARRRPDPGLVEHDPEVDAGLSVTVDLGAAVGPDRSRGVAVVCRRTPTSNGPWRLLGLRGGPRLDPWGRRLVRGVGSSRHGRGRGPLGGDAGRGSSWSGGSAGRPGSAAARAWVRLRRACRRREQARASGPPSVLVRLRSGLGARAGLGAFFGRDPARSRRGAGSVPRSAGASRLRRLGRRSSRLRSRRGLRVRPRRGSRPRGGLRAGAGSGRPSAASRHRRGLPRGSPLGGGPRRASRLRITPRA